MLELILSETFPIVRIQISAVALLAMLTPSEDPPEPKKEKPKDEPKPTSPPPPPPVFAMSDAAGPYRSRPVAPSESSKESWLRRHKNELIHILMATATVASYIVSQTL